MLRFRDKETTMGYNLLLENRRGSIHVLEIHECLKQRLYCWPEHMTPNDLNLAMIKHSAKNA